MLEGYSTRRIQAMNDLMTQAWWISRLVWTKDITLDDLMIKEKNISQSEYNPEDTRAKMFLINAAFGGSVVEHE